MAFAAFATRAFTMITAALSHCVVIQRSSIQKQLRDAEIRLQQCERNIRDLEKNNKDLPEALKKETALRKYFQQRARENESSSEGDVGSHG